MTGLISGCRLAFHTTPPPTRLLVATTRGRGYYEAEMIKPYYEQDGITIYHGDCREILPSLPKVDLVLTDPPYGINWNTDYTRFSGERGVNQKYPAVHGDKEEFDPTPWLAYQCILFGANCYSSKLPRGSWLVWDKRFKNGEAFLADAEIAFWSKGYGVYIYSQTWQGSNKMGETERFHPTQKPAGLMRWCIEKAGKAETILDPFMGSGTTLVAAKQLHRKAIGIEIEQRYCDIAIKRLSQGVLDLSIESNSRAASNHERPSPSLDGKNRTIPQGLFGGEHRRDVENI